MATFNLPGELGVALLTNRPEFVKLAASRVARGELKLTVDDQVTLLKLIQELIEDREKMNSEKTKLANTLSAAQRNMIGISNQLDAVKRMLDGKDPLPYVEDTDV